MILGGVINFPHELVSITEFLPICLCIRTPECNENCNSNIKVSQSILPTQKCKEPLSFLFERKITLKLFVECRLDFKLIMQI